MTSKQLKLSKDIFFPHVPKRRTGREFQREQPQKRGTKSRYEISMERGGFIVTDSKKFTEI